MKKALLFEQLAPDLIRCKTCARQCSIKEGSLGFCKTRINQNGLYCLTYGNISSISNNPIEKKPLYHFFPGTKALTIGTWGCNFTCPFCQNWQISKKVPSDITDQSPLSPAQFLSLLKKYGSKGTSFSLNEPTLLLEYALDIINLTKPLGYYQTYVTNMYMSEEALKLLIETGCDAFCVNLKGDSSFYQKFCQADPEIIWHNLQLAKELGAHIEVVTLIIPHENDSENILQQIAKKIFELLGEDTPWHCNQYYPAYKATSIGLVSYRTPVEILEKAYKIGHDQGLKYVYIGNVHGHRLENTYCPDCETLLIQRTIFGVEKMLLENRNVCPSCGNKIPIINSLKKEPN